MRHFDLSEFACKCCGQLPPNGMNPVLLEALDDLRENLGVPVYVSSGYRCPDHNAAVGGVPNSQHVQGNAADIYIDGRYNKLYNAVIESESFDGVGRYPQSEFVHVDEREDGFTPNWYRWEG